MVNVMITGQHSLVTQMNTSNLITMQTQFFGTIKNTPLRELLNFFFSHSYHILSFCMSSLRIPSPYLWKEFEWLFSQMGNWTIWCYFCIQCKSKYHKRDWQTAQIAPPILQIYWVFPRASVHHGNLFSSRVLYLPL